MRHTRTRPTLAAALALLVLAGATAPARAQYYPGYPGYGPVYPAYGPGGYGYGAGQILQGNAALANAYGGQAIQIQQANLAAEQAKQAKLDTQKKAFDQMNYERENKLWFGQEQAKNEQMLIIRLLNQPVDAEITSGSALNTLLPFLRSVTMRGGPPVPLSPDVVNAINVTVGTSSANAGLLKDGGKLSWPFVLRGPAQKHVDSVLPAAVSAAATDSLDVSLLNEVFKSVEACQTELFTKFKNEEIIGGDYLQGKRYLESLNNAIAVLKSPNASKFLGGTYKASGSTVPELIQNMTAKGLKFAAASPGNEAQYFSLYSSVQAFAGGGHAPDSSFRVRSGPPPGTQAVLPRSQ
jgi:hypothetical protein